MMEEAQIKLEKLNAEDINTHIAKIKKTEQHFIDLVNKSNNQNIDVIVEELNNHSVMGEMAGQDKGLMSPQELLWPIDNYTRRNKFSDVPRLFVYTKT